MINLLKGITIFCAFLLALGCIAPFIPVEKAPYLSFLSLGVPYIVLANLLLLLLALVLRLRLGWVSAVSLVICYFIFGPFYKIGGSNESSTEKTLSVMSYNVLGFDRYDWIKGQNEIEKIRAFIRREDPDIICFQEFEYQQADSFSQYPFNFIHYGSGANTYSIQAIYSKYPILNKGSLDFPSTQNNTIYADIVYKKDTIRVYNIHLQSFKIRLSRRILGRMASGKLYTKFGRVIARQQEQAKIIRDHQASTPYKKILCGDFNNTQFSRVYRLLKGEMTDSFLEKGRGLGTTFKLKFVPLRIDAILADGGLQVESHTNYGLRVSDHFPIMATFSLPETDNSNLPDLP